MDQTKFQTLKGSPRKLQTLRGFRDFLPIKTTSKTRVGIFIDEANLFYIQKELGWKIDWEKFAVLVKKEFDVKILRYYLGMPSSGNAKIKNLKIKQLLESFGYTVVTKPLKKIYTNSQKTNFKYKCNFDVEIALDIASFIDKLDLVIIASSDSDFIATRDFILTRGKAIMFLCFETRVAWEIRRSKHLFFEEIKNLVKLKNPSKRWGEITKP